MSYIIVGGLVLLVICTIMFVFSIGRDSYNTIFLLDKISESFVVNPMWKKIAQRDLPEHIYAQIIWDENSDNIPPTFEKLLNGDVRSPNNITYTHYGAIVVEN